MHHDDPSSITALASHAHQLARALFTRVILMMFVCTIIWGLAHGVTVVSPSLVLQLMAGAAFGIAWSAWMYYRDYDEIAYPIYTRIGVLWVGILSASVGVMYLFLAFDAVNVAQLIAVATVAIGLIGAWASI